MARHRCQAISFRPEDRAYFVLVVVEEPGRAIGAKEIADVLGRPVIARVPSRDSVARAVDAGVLAHRLPDALARPAATALRAVGLLWDQRGAAA